MKKPLKKNEKKKDLIEERDSLSKQKSLLLYFQIQMTVVYDTHFKMAKAAKTKYDEERADYFLKFNMSNFLEFSNIWLRKNFDVTASSKHLEEFIADWNKMVTEEMMPEYNKEIELMKERYKPKIEADYFQ